MFKHIQTTISHALTAVGLVQASLPLQLVAPTAETALVSRNGREGAKMANRSAQRNAQKKRNVVRNRLAHRGS